MHHARRSDWPRLPHEVNPDDPMDHTNLHSHLARLTPHYKDNPKRAALDPELSSLTFDGFVRPDGEVGIRNMVGIVTSGMCSSTEVRKNTWRANREIYSTKKFPNVDGVVPIIHESGCGMPDGEPSDHAQSTACRFRASPEPGSLHLCRSWLRKDLRRVLHTCVVEVGLMDYNRRVVDLTIRRLGGSEKTVAKGLEVVEKMLHYANQFKRQPVSISKLIVGTECGGSDRWSGVAANPAVGVASDMFVKAGAADLLAVDCQASRRRDARPCTARAEQESKQLVGALERYEAYVKKFGDYFADNPFPGNIKGGLYNIYLKSTGVKAKGGTAIVEDLIEYGEWLGHRKGLYVLYTPGYDHICTPALFLSGAQVTLFTTGRGTSIRSLWAL